jgi:hypothetical protein
MTSSVLEASLRRDRLLISGALGMTAALAWGYVLWLAADMDMSGMDIGSRMIPAGLGLMALADAWWGVIEFAFVFVMWAVMMIGMMAPSVAPMILSAMDLGIADHGERAGREQAAQIAIALLADEPSLSLPPLEFCFGTSPTQAEKSRPDRKVLGSCSRPALWPAPDRRRGFASSRLLVAVDRRCRVPSMTLISWRRTARGSLTAAGGDGAHSTMMRRPIRSRLPMLQVNRRMGTTRSAGSRAIPRCRDERSMERGEIGFHE